MFLDVHYLLMWLGAFALTQVIEAPIYARWCVRGNWRAALLASTWTHPVLWFVATPLWQHLRWPLADLLGSDPAAWDMPVLYAMEVAIAMAEGAWLRRCAGVRPWLWAVVGNGASFLTGELIYWMTGQG